MRAAAVRGTRNSGFAGAPVDRLRWGSFTACSRRATGAATAGGVLARAGRRAAALPRHGAGGWGPAGLADRRRLADSRADVRRVFSGTAPESRPRGRRSLVLYRHGSGGFITPTRWSAPDGGAGLLCSASATAPPAPTAAPPTARSATAACASTPRPRVPPGGRLHVSLKVRKRKGHKRPRVASVVFFVRNGPRRVDRKRRTRTAAGCAAAGSRAGSTRACSSAGRARRSWRRRPWCAATHVRLRPASTSAMAETARTPTMC